MKKNDPPISIKQNFLPSAAQHQTYDSKKEFLAFTNLLYRIHRRIERERNCLSNFDQTQEDEVP